MHPAIIPVHRHPNVSINDKGELDFSKVYTNEIGEWDKRAIVYGYTDFGNGKEDNAALNKLLEENTRNGLLYISDADARAADGMPRFLIYGIMVPMLWMN